MTRLSCLAVLLLAFLASGCGLTGSAKTVPPPKALSHAEFVRRANHICAVAIRRTKRFREPPANDVTLIRDVNGGIRALEGAIFAFRGLTPPPSDAAAFGRLLADMDTADSLEHKLVNAAAAQQVPLAKGVAGRLLRIDKRLDRRSKNLGLRTCAKHPPTPRVAPPAPPPPPGNTNSSGNGTEFTINGHVFRIVTVAGKMTLVEVR